MYLSNNTIYLPKKSFLDIPPRTYLDQVIREYHLILEQDGMISEKAFSEQDRIAAEAKEIVNQNLEIVKECEEMGKRVEFCAEMIWDRKNS